MGKSINTGFKKKYKLYKFISMVCIITLLMNSFFSVASASTEGVKVSSVLGKEPIGKISNKEKVEVSIFSKEITDDVIADKLPESPQQVTKAEIPQKVREVLATATRTYTMSDLNALNYNDLVDLLVTLDWSDITDLFKYSQAAYEFYSNTTRMQTLINAVKDRGSQYTSTDNKGIPTLVEVIRAGFYLSFYNSQLSELGQRSYHDKCLPAITAVMSNSNFKLGTAQQDDVVSAMGLLMWNGSTNADVINRTIPIFQQFQTNINTYIKDNGKSTAIYNLGGGIEYDISSAFYDGITPPNSIWYRKIDNYTAQVEKIALLGNVNSDNGWLINNGLYWMGTLGKVHSDASIGNRVLTQAMSLYTYLGQQYFQAAASIVDNYNGIDYYGNRLDMEKITRDGKNKYLPKKYTFDDSKMVIYTGNNVTVDKVKRLYWASNEVRAQLYRSITKDNPLESGNADEILTCYIYNNPDEYGMNQYLFGLDTNNGGMYIESWGSFFTYERTIQDSIYTLEELFRHEFTHYLQGRYIVPGMWGNSPIYYNDKLTWFEEGSAEWFAGSTRTDGVVPRKSMVGNIGSAADRYSLSQTLHSSYNSGFTFYTYAFAFYNYMYEKNMGLFNDLHDAVMANNVSAYDLLISQYSSDTALNSAYQNQMQYLVNNKDSFYVPLVADDYLLTHPIKSMNEISSDITSVIELRDVTTTTSQSDFFKTFTLRGKYTKASSQGRLADWKAMDLVANNALKTLNSYNWSGYKTVVCYFTNYKVNSSNAVEFDVVFHGICTDDGTIPVNNPPIAEANGPYTGTKGTAISFSSAGSNDTDGTIVSYLWDFGDGGTSNQANPSYAYSTAGTFTATLTVTDDKGAKGTDAAQVAVNNIVNNLPVAEANGPYTGTKGTAISFSSAGSNDTDGTIVSYLWDFGDGGTSNQANPSYVYSTAGTFTATLTVTDDKGAKGTDTAQVIVSEIINPGVGITIETEPNNTFDTANGPIANNLNVSAKFDSNDNADVYYFNVKSNGTVDINVTASSGLGMNWMLYKASDLTNYVAYPSSTTGGVLSGSYNATAGKYYLYVYKYSGTGSYTVNINGPIDNEVPVNNLPVAEANGPYTGTKGTAISFSSAGSNDTDGTIVSYLWDFGDGGTSNQANPSYVYSTAGVFTATLTVTDDMGAKSTDTAQVTVNEKIVGITIETEPNNTFDTANGPIANNINVSAKFDSDDNADVYYFDVNSNGTVDINVTASSGLGMSWMLYKAPDLTNYVAYPTSTTGGVLSGSYNATSGGYYLYAYKYSGMGSYSININGPLK